MYSCILLPTQQMTTSRNQCTLQNEMFVILLHHNNKTDQM